MKNYPAPAPGTEWRFNEQAAAANLELPVNLDFRSLPPRVDGPAMLRRIEENLSWRSTRPGEKERRLAEKVAEEFIL